MRSQIQDYLLNLNEIELKGHQSRNICMKENPSFFWIIFLLCSLVEEFTQWMQMKQVLFKNEWCQGIATLLTKLSLRVFPCLRCVGDEILWGPVRYCTVRVHDDLSWGFFLRSKFELYQQEHKFLQYLSYFWFLFTWKF